MPTRAEMSVETRGKLMAAACELFARQPYAKTNVEDIAAAAGMTKGAFYHHYANKQELLLATQHALLDEAIRASEEIAARGLSPSDEVRALLALHLRGVTTHRQLLSITVSERSSVAPSKWRAIRAKRDRIEAFLVDAIKRGQDDGDFTAPGEPRLQAYAVLGMCYWSQTWYREDRSWSLEQVAATMADMALAGLRGAPHAPAVRG